MLYEFYCPSKMVVTDMYKRLSSITVEEFAPNTTAAGIGSARSFTFRSFIHVPLLYLGVGPDLFHLASINTKRGLTTKQKEKVTKRAYFHFSPEEFRCARPQRMQRADEKF